MGRKTTEHLLRKPQSAKHKTQIGRITRLKATSKSVEPFLEHVSEIVKRSRLEKVQHPKPNNKNHLALENMGLTKSANRFQRPTSKADVFQNEIHQARTEKIRANRQSSLAVETPPAEESVTESKQQGYKQWLGKDRQVQTRSRASKKAELLTRARATRVEEKRNPQSKEQQDVEFRLSYDAKKHNSKRIPSRVGVQIV